MQIETEKIKRNIVRSKDLIIDGVPWYLNPVMLQGTNCYAYALGILYPGKIGIHYHPGFTEGLAFCARNGRELLESIYLDLKNLDIKFRELNLDSEVILEENEYLIKVFFLPHNDNLPMGDFHFIRQDPLSKNWIDKLGWSSQPDLVQSLPGVNSFIPGSEPQNILHLYENGSIASFEPVSYFAITEQSHLKYSTGL